MIRIMRQEISSRIRMRVFLNMLPIVIMMVYYYTHYIEGTYSFIIPLGLTMFWLVLTMPIIKINNLLFNKVSTWWLVYFMVCFLMSLIGMSSTNLNFVISRLPIYIIPAIGYFVLCHYNSKEKKLLLWAFALIYGLNLVYNIFLGITLPGIFEEQESTELSIQYGIMMNIAPTSFITIGVWLIGALMMLFLVIGKLWNKLFCTLLIIPIAYYLFFQNTRATALVLLVVEIVGIFIAYFEPKIAKNRKAYYWISGMFIIVVTLLVLVPLTTWILENIESERLAERLKDIQDLGESRGKTDQLSEGSFSQRIQLSLTSLNSFLSTPISFLIGIGDHTQTFGSDLQKSGIGGHSEFFDVLGRYGLVGAFVFWKILKNYYRMLKRISVNRDVRKYVNILFFVYLLFGVFNNIFEPSPLLFSFVILPIVIEFTENKLKVA